MNALTVLRGLACLAVIIWHVEPPRNSLYFHSINLSFLTFPSGIVAVWIFFLLSGYLMGKVFTQEKYQLNLKSILRFYYQRISKILPLYYTNIIICSLFIYKWIIDLFPGTLVLLFTFTANNFPGLNWFNPPLWAISTEMQFYLFVPLFAVIIKFLSRKKIPSLLFLGLTLIFGLSVRYLLYYNFAFSKVSEYITYIYTPLVGNLDFFLFGYLINQFISNPNRKILNLCNKKTAVIFLISLFILGNYFSMTFFMDYDNFKIPVVFILPAITCLTLGFFLIAFEKKIYHRKYIPLTLEKMIINSLKKPLAIFELIGSVSLGMYLWHKPLIDTFRLVAGDKTTLAAALGKASAAVVLSFLAGLISHFILSLSFSRFRGNRTR